MRVSPLRCVTIGLALNFFIAHLLFAGEPTEQLQTTIEGVRAALKEVPAGDTNRKGRQQQLRALIHSRFDLLAMAKRSLGAYWKSLTADEQGEFAQLFSGLLETASTSVLAYGGASVQYKRETQEGGYSRVETRIVNQQGDEIAVDYNLLLADGEWKVYDVVIENISMVNNYRSQFSRVIAESSFKELLHRIKEKQARDLAIKPAGDKLAPRPGNIRNDSRPLILVTLIGSSNDRQLIPRP